MTRSIRLVLPFLVAAGLPALPYAAAAQQSNPAGALGETHVVEVTATDYAFRAPDAVPAGWTTIRFKNDGEEPHFVFMSRLPEGKTVEEYELELSVPYSRAWYSIRDGHATPEEALETLFEELPAWMADLEMIGGPGLAAPGRTTDVMVHLQPGNYVLECYMKTEDGEVHYMEGMIRPLVVTEDRSDATPPDPDIRVTLSNNQLALEGDVTAGRRVVAVHAAENPEVGFGHSAHLARLDGETSVEEVAAWMNFFAPTGLAAPAPAEFIGGVHAMPDGHTAYITVDLTPGRYLFVSEATAHLGVLREFTVR